MESIKQILARMDTITLGEMDACALMNRVDTKYVFDVGTFSEILEKVAPDYRVLSVTDSRFASYENLYFDTPEHHCYFQHHNGKLNRHKCRVRRYVDSDLCFLEVKSKNNKGRTAKERVAINRFEHTLSDSSREYVGQITGNESHWLPQMWSRFSRITLVSSPHLERATFDVDLNFSHNGSRREFPGIVIAEIKQQKRNRKSPLLQVMKRQGLRETRISKYCLGCIALKPHLKHNRFKRKLNTINRIAS